VLIKAATGAMAAGRASGASRTAPWAPFALLASPAEEASLFVEGGTPKLVRGLRPLGPRSAVH
jgi:hypothetical protein